MFYIAVCMSEVPPLLVVEFLHRFVDIVHDYFGSAKHHQAHIMGVTKQALKDAKLTRHDIDAIAYTKAPFTVDGLSGRVCTMASRTGFYVNAINFNKGGF